MLRNRFHSYYILVALFVLTACSNGVTPSPLATKTALPHATITGTATLPITPTATLTLTAIVSPALRGRIAFTDSSHIYSTLAILDLNQATIQNVTTGTGAWEGLSWSPNGQWIAFTGLLAASQSSAIVLTDPKTDQSKMLTNASPGSNPQWSSDSRLIVYNAEGDLAIAGIEGKTAYKLTYTPGFESYPAWSPDGKKIVYVYQKTTTSPNELWLMDSDGHNSKRVTDIQIDYNSQIDWSPDGEWITFVSLDHLENGLGNACGDIYIVRPDGSDLTRLTNLSGCATSVSWSPDGTKIAFIGRNRLTNRNIMKSGWQIFVMDTNGQNIVQVTNEAEWVLYSLDWDPSLK